MGRGRKLAVAVFAAVLLVPRIAFAAPGFAVSSAPSEVLVSRAPTTGLDWSVGSPSQGGCLACHGNPGFVGVVQGRLVSLYVDTLALQRSAHGRHQCTDCHPGFKCEAPHSTADAGGNWRRVAKTACEDCHAAQYRDWVMSYHSAAASGTGTPRVGRAGSSAPGKPMPLCGDCHQGHSIPARNDDASRSALHASASTMCGGCHPKAWADYVDYYHGSAYRRGAPDAPACWQCHDTHRVFPSQDRRCSTYRANLVATCSRCHKGAGKDYVQYEQLIHSLDAEYQRNPVFSAMDSMIVKIMQGMRGVLSVCGIRSS